MRIGVIRFPGSNCDRDVYQVIKLAGGEVEYVWWNKDDLSYLDGVIIPGGFSYGDYLRAGAIASITPVIEGINSLVKEEKPVLGICNGAQILAEVGLVPGIFTVNENSKFICQWENLKIKTNRTPFTKGYKKNEIIKMPIAHSEGRYFNQNIDLLKDQDQIVVQFADKNPNGSLNRITGICDESGLICAIMPHPERASSKLLGSDHGLNFFKGML